MPSCAPCARARLAPLFDPRRIVSGLRTDLDLHPAQLAQPAYLLCGSPACVRHQTGRQPDPAATRVCEPLYEGNQFPIYVRSHVALTGQQPELSVAEGFYTITIDRERPSHMLLLEFERA